MDKSNFLVYRASAGSGKTFALAVQYVKLLLSGVSHAPHRHILAVTFTKAATNEMKERILAELFGLANGLFDKDHPQADEKSRSFMDALLEELPGFDEKKVMTRAAAALSAILHDYSRFHIATIDSFFQQVARGLAKELGVGSKFNLELNTEIPLKNAVKALITEAVYKDETLDRIFRYLSHKLEDGKWNIEKELLDFGRNIFKEEFQEHESELRKQLKDIPQKTKDAKKIKSQFEDEMNRFVTDFRSQLNQLGVSEDEFSGGSRNFLSSYFKKIESKRFRDDEILNKTMEKCLGDPEQWVAKSNSGRARLVSLVNTEFLPRLKKNEHFRQEHIIDYNTARLMLKYIYPLELIEDIAQKLEEQNLEQNRFMLAHTAQLLSTIIQDSDASFVYEKIGAEIRHVLIDEFQDTSSLQWKNFKSLLSEVVANNRFGMLVGDVKQSIYRWRNSNWRILNNIDKEKTLRLAGKNLKQLDVNYRSLGKVVAFNNDLFKTMASVLSDEYDGLYDNKNPEDNPFAKAYKDVEQKTKKENTGYISVEFCEKNETEDYSYVVTRKVLSKITQLKTMGVKESDICILCRKNKQIRELAEMLANEQITVISADAYLLSSSKALQMLISALRAIAEPDNPLPKAELYKLRYGITEHGFSDNWQDDITALLAGKDSLPLYEMVQALCRDLELERQEGQADFLYVFMDKLTEYLSRNPSDINAFLEYWDEKLYAESLPVSMDDAHDGVLAMSIHKSKGLQFHTVIIPFCDWEMAEKSSPFKQNLVWCGAAGQEPFDLALFPVEYGSHMNQSRFHENFQDETVKLWMDNLNVFYVACTRAEKNLAIFSKRPSDKGTTLRIESLLYNALKENNTLSPNFNSDDGYFETGEIIPSSDKKHTFSSNPFRDVRKNSLPISYQTVKRAIPLKKSRQAEKFLDDREDVSRNEYIQEGNIIHAIFSSIKTLDDIEKSVDELAESGLINGSKRKYYADLVKEYIFNAHKEDWYSLRYQVFNECPILSRNDIKSLETLRPDRVMRDKVDQHIIIVDYKTGKEHPAHIKQAQKYMQLILEMGYRDVEGWVWYLKENRVVSC